ncbi:MAG: fluoride efflux transporter CrcB [Deltaproteobacteria bacterium]|nr:fluoride efflux transporter CrcB [Deltaproteobacteria bacterium]
MKLLWISLGGALGAAARYGLSGWLAAGLGPAFPWGTLAVNALGSFGLAFLMHLGLTTELLPPNLRIAVGTGFFGALTTYSTFNYEATLYLQERAYGLAALYFGGMVVTCLLCGFAGLLLARQIFGS